MKFNIRKLTILLARQIVERTKRGKDKLNKSFKPYSKSYAKSKKQTNVDLTLSGYMLNNVSAISDDRIGFKSNIALERAGYNANMGRLFIGLDNTQIDYILKWIHDLTLKQVYKEAKTWKFR